MKKLLLAILTTAILASNAFALPKPSRIIEVEITGNSYNASTKFLTMTAAERYATVKLRPAVGLKACLSWVAAPNTYTANAARSWLSEGELKELWNFKLFAGTMDWYANTTLTAGTVTLEIETFSNTVP